MDYDKEKFKKMWLDSSITTRVISKEFGLKSRGAVYQRADSLGLPQVNRMTKKPIETPSIPAPKQRAKVMTRLTTDWGKMETALVYNDTQNPYEDKVVLALMEQFMGELQPDYLFINGDAQDFYPLSKFDKNPDRLTHLQGDLDNTSRMLGRQRTLLPNARIIQQDGNHEDRLRRFLWGKVPELASLRCLDLNKLLGLDENEISHGGYEEGVLINGVFLILHGNIVSIHSSYTAKRMYDKHGQCGMHGHTHRGGSYFKTDRFGTWGWWENFCIVPETPVLMANLIWEPLGSLSVGDEIIGFDEFPQPKKLRKLRRAEVLALKKVDLPTYEITLVDGRTVRASEDHLWLRADTVGEWVKTKNLKTGYHIRQIGKPWGQPQTWEAGYLAGVLDGEGWADGFTPLRPNVRIGFAQNPNPLLDKAREILREFGITFSERGNKRNISIMVRATSGLANGLKLLGMVRPPRLLEKVKLDAVGFPTKLGKAEIIGVKPIGTQELISIETTTKTLFANGLASHNCLCDLDPDYIQNPNWQHGFSLIHFKKKRFWVEQVPIIQGKFIYGGRLYGGEEG